MLRRYPLAGVALSLVALTISANASGRRGQETVPASAPATTLALPVGHTGEVTAVAYSSNGALLLSGSFDGTARLWDVASGVLLRTFVHEEGINGVAFSPDDTRIGTAGFDGTGRVWDTASGARLQTLSHGSTLVNAIAFTPDGKTVITGADNDVREWNVATGEVVRVLSEDGTKALAIDRHTGRIAIGAGDVELLQPGGNLPPVTLAARAGDGPVWSVAFSPDGTHLVTGNNGGTVRVWVVATGELRHTLKARSNVWSVSFSHDGTLVAAGSNGGGPEIWSVGTGASTRAFANREGVRAVAFSIDDKHVIAGGDDKSVTLLSLTDGSIARRFSGEPDVVGLIVPSADSRFLYTVSQTGQSHTWDLDAGRVIMSHAGRAASPQTGAFSKDGGLLLSVAADEKSLDVWSTRSLDVRTTLRAAGSHLRACAISPDGQTIVTGDADGLVRIWDVSSKRLVKTLSGHTATINSIAVSWLPGRRQIVSGSEDKTVRLWDLDSGETLRTITRRLEVESVALSPDGRYFLTALKWDGDGAAGTSLWDTSSGTLIRDLPGNGPVAFSADGASVWSVSGTTVLLHAASDGRLMRTFEHQSAIEAIAISPDGTRLLVGDVHQSARLWEIATGNTLHQFRLDGGFIRSVGWTPDGQQAVMMSGGHVAIVVPETGRVVKTYPGVFEFHQLAVSASGMIVGAVDTAPRLWPLAGTTELRSFTQHQAEFEGASLAPDGDRIMTHGFGTTAFVWDLATGREVRRLEHPGGVYWVAFAPDGGHGVTGSHDNIVRVWNLATGKVVRTMSSDGCPASIVDWSSDGRRILGAGIAETVCTWQASDGRLLFRAAVDLDVSDAKFSPDGHTILINAGAGKRAIMLDDTPPLVLDARTGATVTTLVSPTRRVHAATILADRQTAQIDRQLAVVANSDGTLSAMGWSPHRELGRLIYQSDETWAMVSPTGHFDTNDIEGLRGLHWVFREDPFTPLAPETFVRDFYEPLLLPRLLARESFGQKTLTVENRVQPIVEIGPVTWIDPIAGRAQVTVTVKRGRPNAAAADSSSPLLTPNRLDPYDLRLFRNGQLVGWAPSTALAQSAAKATADKDPIRWRELTHIGVDEDGARRLTFDVQVPRRPSLKTVTFSAYAFNESRVKSATVTRTEPLPETLQDRPGKAYVITVGVNRTDSAPAWNLKYAVNDARRLGEVVTTRLNASTLFADKVVPIRLVSDHTAREPDEGPATKAALEVIFDRLAGRPVDARRLQTVPRADQLARAEPEDLVVFAFSSHGYTNKAGTFHFVLADIGPDKADVSPALDLATLSSDELSVWLPGIDAGEMLLIVDACQSAATISVNGFRPGPMGSRGLGQLAYDKGMRVLAASKADESAIERGGDITSGLLTYALAQRGLINGSADFRPRDGAIRLREWLTYAVIEVPGLFREGDQRGTVAAGDGTRDAYHGRKKTPRAYQQPVLFDFARELFDVNLSGATRIVRQLPPERDLP